MVFVAVEQRTYLERQIQHYLQRQYCNRRTLSEYPGKQEIIYKDEMLLRFFFHLGAHHVLCRRFWRCLQLEVRRQYTPGVC